MLEMVRRITVRAIVLHEGKLLGVRLKAYKKHLENRKNDYWCLPGGGLDEGEALLDGIRREMIEETGITPVIGNLLYIQQFAYDGKDYLEFFFHITNAEDYMHIDLSKASHGEIEIEEIDFIDPAKKHILPEFLSTEDLETVAISGGPARIISRL